MTISLLETKLNCPPLQHDWVSRQRLLDVLEHGLGHSLVLVSAPAGYGKSVLIRQWLESCQTSSTWLSLDAEDNNLVGFIAYVVAAVQRLFPQACSDTQALLRSTNLLSIATALVSTLVNDLNAIESPFILVLDDYHYIHEPAIHELLTQLLRYPPRALTLVILTRRDPPLPLTSLRAQSKLTELRLRDLKFTPSETAAFLESVLRCRVGRVALANLEDQLEGWVGGLHLLSLVLPYQADSDKFLKQLNGELSLIKDYLLQQVLAHQSTTMQEWLKRSSILNRFCPSLLEAVCKTKQSAERSGLDGQTFLKALETGNLFTIALTDQADWCRYHHLFQELLNKRLQYDYSPETIAALHERASLWLESQGLIEEAIYHALKAEDIVGTAQIIERHRMAEMNADRWYALETWLNGIPQPIRQQRLPLLLCQLWIAYNGYRLTEIPGLIEQAERLRRDSPFEPNLLAELNILNGIIDFWQGQCDRSLEYFEIGLEQLPAEAYVIRAEGELHACLALYTLGQEQAATQRLNSELRQLDANQVAARLRLVGSLMLIYLLAGKFPQAAEAARQLERIGQTHASLYAQSWGHYGQALTDLSTNSLERALTHFCFVNTHHYGLDTRVIVDALVGLALTYQALHQPDKVTETIEQLIEFAWTLNDPEMLSVAHSGQARLALQQGDLLSATQWVQSFNQPPNFPTMFCWLEVPAITQARVLVSISSEQSLQTAMELLHHLWQGTEALRYTGQMIEIEVLQVLALERQGHHQQALSMLETVVAMAEPGGIMRPFIELGAPMAVLLRQLPRQDSQRYFIQQLLMTVQGVAEQPAMPGQTLVEPLTQREAEILEMLSQRLHDKEIAQKLGISTTTVKSHLRNLYQKLDAHNRRQAATRAVELGLIDAAR
jgi:LuxR family maltose regulon positive regulatory protein